MTKVKLRVDSVLDVPKAIHEVVEIEVDVGVGLQGVDMVKCLSEGVPVEQRGREGEEECEDEFDFIVVGILHFHLLVPNRLINLLFLFTFICFSERAHSEQVTAYLVLHLVSVEPLSTTPENHIEEDDDASGKSKQLSNGCLLDVVGLNQASIREDDGD